VWFQFQGEQRGELGDLVIGDPSQHIGEPGLRINVAELSSPAAGGPPDIASVIRDASQADRNAERTDHPACPAFL
jgi:hypothetical protein